MTDGCVEGSKMVTIIFSESIERTYQIEILVLIFHHGLYVSKPCRLIACCHLTLGAYLYKMHIVCQELAILDGMAHPLHQTLIQRLKRMVGMCSQRVSILRQGEATDIVCHLLIHSMTAHTPIIYREQWSRNVVVEQSLKDGVHYSPSHHLCRLLGLRLPHQGIYLLTEYLPNLLVHIFCHLPWRYQQVKNQLVSIQWLDGSHADSLPPILILATTQLGSQYQFLLG